MVKKWEYKVVSLESDEDGIKEDEAKLNSLGNKGWEIVGMIGEYFGPTLAYLKREKAE